MQHYAYVDLTTKIILAKLNTKAWKKIIGKKYLMGPVTVSVVVSKLGSSLHLRQQNLV